MPVNYDSSVYNYNQALVTYESAENIVVTAITGFSEPFVQTHPFYDGLYTPVYQRTAINGAGTGSATVSQVVTQYRLSQLTDFSFPYRFGGRFYLGVRAVINVSATGSGIGSGSMSGISLRQRQGTSTGLGAGSATKLRTVLRSGNNGSGTGSSAIGQKVTQLRLGGLTDFSFPYRFGGQFYVGAPLVWKTATGSGTGTSFATEILVSIRTASGSGIGSSSSTAIEILPRSATGSGAGSTSGGAIGLHIAPRTATGSGQGTQTAFRVISKLRTATGSGTGTQSATGLHIAPRTATGSGTSSQSAARLVTRIRTANGSGVGANGTVLWIKSFIFRPPADGQFRWAEFGDKTAAGRLFGRVSAGRSASNIYKLTNGTYTNVDTRDYTIVEKVYHGGHDNFVTADEKVDLIAAGYGEYVT